MLNKELQVSIIDEDDNGNGVFKKDGLVGFVKGALKDEELLVLVTDVKKRFIKARVVKVLKPSLKRKKVVCDKFYECGGCNFLHVDSQIENESKYNYIRSLFHEYNVKPIISSNLLHYRNKATFHVNDNRLVYFEEDSHDVVFIDNCALVNPIINDMINRINKLDLSNVSSVLIRISETTGEVMTRFSGNAFIDSIKEYCDSIYIDDKLIYGNPYITENINGILFTIYPDSFFQVNTSMMIKLYDVVKEYASCGNSLLDLYCGTGTIGIYLKDNFKNVFGVEINESSIKNANLNKKLNSIKNCEFLLGDSKTVVNNCYDVVVVDPPRSGLSKNVINNLLEMKSNKIIYVSCNPKTLKRDIELLENKYYVKEITPVNMFYRTSHVECVSILERK